MHGADKSLRNMSAVFGTMLEFMYRKLGKGAKNK